MPVQMRLNPSDDRFYSPDRDLAYCAPHLIHRAMCGLDYEAQEPWIRAYLADHNISNDALADAARAIATYMNHALMDPAHKEPFFALEAAGFFKLDPKVQHVVLAKMGQILLSASFTCIRDVTRQPNDPPFKTTEIADAAADLSDKITKYNSRPHWVNRIRAGLRCLCSWFKR